jgi:competence protein ComEA
MKKILVLLLAVVCLISISPTVGWTAADASAKTANSIDTINVNTATASELQRLPDIGKVTAERIIEYRSAEGPFRTPEDLLKVKGIGKKVLEKIRESISVE